MSFQVDKSMNSWDRRHTYRTLTCLPKCLEQSCTTIGLRNETSVSGRIVYVDAQMNISMEDVAYVEYEGNYKFFPQLFVPARMIRDVVIPEEVSVTDMLNDALPSSKTKVEKPPKPKPKRTFKAKRAMMNNQDALRRIQEIKQSKNQQETK